MEQVLGVRGFSLILGFFLWGRIINFFGQRLFIFFRKDYCKDNWLATGYGIHNSCDVTIYLQNHHEEGKVDYFPEKQIKILRSYQSMLTFRLKHFWILIMNKNKIFSHKSSVLQLLVLWSLAEPGRTELRPARVGFLCFHQRPKYKTSNIMSLSPSLSMYLSLS